GRRGGRMIRRIAASLAIALGVAAWVATAHAQDGDEGLGPAPGEPRAVLSAALEAMGGRATLSRVRTAVVTIDNGPGQVRERYVLRSEGRFFHYSSRRQSGAGFDVVLTGPVSFLCDRKADGSARRVEELPAADTGEAAYERDVLFMPLLLPALLADEGSRLQLRGLNSAGEQVVRAVVRPPRGAVGEPFVVRLKFNPETKLPVGVMGAIPSGPEEGKKRYTDFSDYREVGGLTLPHGYSDARGRDAEPREFSVSWTVNPDLPPDLFVRPRTEDDD
ncbi:hypothetical protein OAX78_03590, partial [Planctomycetota bacterium]|nr:hypothetical protein [Planctomycetota bacterium]